MPWISARRVTGSGMVTTCSGAGASPDRVGAAQQVDHHVGAVDQLAGALAHEIAGRLLGTLADPNVEPVALDERGDDGGGVPGLALEQDADPALVVVPPLRAGGLAWHGVHLPWRHDQVPAV